MVLQRRRRLGQLLWQALLLAAAACPACQAQQECSFTARRASCTDCAGAACVWPMPLQRQLPPHEAPEVAAGGRVIQTPLSVF